MENNKNKRSVKFQGDMLNFCDFIQVFVFTTNHHLKPFYLSVQICHLSREYARGRRERRNRFRPADIAFFSSERDKNVALIFRKIRCFSIHFNIHTCHQLVFDLGRSSTRYPSGLHKKIDT